MKILILTLLLAITTLSAQATKTIKTESQETFVFKTFDGSQSHLLKGLTRWPASNNSCISSCRFQFQLCNAYNLYPNCGIRLERCVEACFN